MVPCQNQQTGSGQLKQSSFFPIMRALFSVPVIRDGALAAGIVLTLKTLADNDTVTAAAAIASAGYIGYQYVPVIRQKVDAIMHEFINEGATKAMLGR